jgi:hypothetical protein
MEDTEGTEQEKEHRKEVTSGLSLDLYDGCISQP